jgi:glycosyltransferase involved in cell wall biosynthesis
MVSLVACCERALRFEPRCTDPIAHHVLMMEQVLRDAHKYDVIHCHIDYLGFPLARRLKPVPTLHTMHGRMDLWHLQLLLREFSELPLVSISNAQRAPVPWANWVATVYHGLPRELYQLREHPEEYLVYVGRISPEKRVDAAVQIALGAEMPLKIAAKVDRADRDYYETVIKPLVRRSSLVEFLGEVSDQEKQELVGRALAFLHPVDWPEPFGLAMIEAMACGTPVLARRCGSIPEVVEPGLTGYIFRSTEEAVRFIKLGLRRLDRKAVRARFLERFDARRMAQEYVALYERLLQKELRPQPWLRLAG